jgi:hypothetical protein
MDDTLRRMGLDRTRARMGAVRPKVTGEDVRRMLADIATAGGVPFVDAASQAQQGNYGQAAISGLLDAPPVKMAGMALAPLAGIISPQLAKRIKMDVSLPTSEEFNLSVQNTPNARITPEGLEMMVQRNQVPSQAGMESVRTGVFYLPEGSSSTRYYKGQGGGSWYGGTQSLSGETVVKNPLFVKGATGGKVPEAAYEQVMGKGSLKKLDNDVFRVIGAKSATRSDPKLFEEYVGDFLKEYGSNPEMAKYIIQNSGKGNQLRYALRENVIANSVRNAGYDSVLGYSKTKTGPKFSELFDLRESTYPTQSGESVLRKEFSSLLD